jgi:hypothetical protein
MSSLLFRPKPRPQKHTLFRGWWGADLV